MRRTGRAVQCCVMFCGIRFAQGPGAWGRRPGQRVARHANAAPLARPVLRLLQSGAARAGRHSDQPPHLPKSGLRSTLCCTLSLLIARGVVLLSWACAVRCVVRCVVRSMYAVLYAVPRDRTGGVVLLSWACVVRCVVDSTLCCTLCCTLSLLIARGVVLLTWACVVRCVVR